MATIADGTEVRPRAAGLSIADGRTAKAFIYSALGWMLLGMLMGFFASILLIVPDWLGGLPGALKQYFTFGRIRPVHTNLVMFGWLTGIYFATTYYMVPRLAGTKGIYSEKLGMFTVALFNITLLLAAGSIMAGYNMGREYAEIPWLVKLPLVVTFLATLYNVAMTVARRTEKQLYVTLWYILAALTLTPVIYLIGNQFLLPVNPVSGINDAVLNWFYGHNILGYWFTPVGVGAVYYLLPKLTGNPLYSHRLSMIGFWTIMFVYGPTGAHHLVNGPVPYWLQSVAIAFSITLLIPVWTVVANFFGTMKGKWAAAKESYILKFLMSGVVFYFITCFQGPMQALRSVSAITHFTSWVVGHAHLALLGAFSFIMWAVVYYALPRIVGKHIYSDKLANWHYWITLTGFTIFVLSLTVGGLVQGFTWAATGSEQFILSVEAMLPYNILRSIGGGLVIVGQMIFTYNVWLTVRKGDAFRLPTQATGQTVQG